MSRLSEPSGPLRPSCWASTHARIEFRLFNRVTAFKQTIAIVRKLLLRPAQERYDEARLVGSFEVD